MSALTAPKRAWCMNLNVQADTREELASALWNLATMIDRKEVNGPSGCSGGVGSGYFYEIEIDESITHEQYRKSLDDYLAASRAAAPGRGDASG